MARLQTVGFATQISSSTGSQHGEAAGGVGGAFGAGSGSPVFNTSVQRSGAACMEFDQGAGVAYTTPSTGTPTLARTYYYRTYVRATDATPSGFIGLITVLNTAATVIATLRLETNGTLTIRDSGGTQIGGASAALSDNTWYRVELAIRVEAAGNGTLEARLDGTSFASGSASVTNVAPDRWRTGTPSGGGTAGQKIYFDDVALNDDQGADQNSWPGEGSIVLLKPTSQNSIGNWVGPQTTGDDVTNLETNVDNTPPLGDAFADTDANADKWVHNVVSAAGNNFDVNVQSYDAAGIPSSAAITLVQALARVSVNTTTGTNTAAVAGVSNPACTATTGFNLETTAVAGTEPAGWKSIRSAVAYAPSVTRATEPVVRVTKEVANANAAMVDLMGLYVEFVPPTPATLSLAAGAATFAGTAALTAPALLATAAGAATFAGAAMAIKAPVAVLPNAAAATFAGGSMTIRTPAPILANAAAATFAGGSMAIRTPAPLLLGPAAITVAGTLAVAVPRPILPFEAPIEFRAILNLEAGPAPPAGIVRIPPPSSVAVELERDPGAAGFVVVTESELQFPAAVDNVGGIGSEDWANPDFAAASGGGLAAAELGYKETVTNTRVNVTGWHTPAVGETSSGFVAPAGAGVWNNPAGARFDDGSYATWGGFFVPMPVSELLVTRSYGFAIPPSATVIGVIVRILKFPSVGGPPPAIFDNDVRLVVFGGGTGTNHADPTDGWLAGGEWSEYGNGLDNWGIGLTPGAVNRSDFGVLFRAQRAFADALAHVDSIQMQVWYVTESTTVVSHRQTSRYLKASNFEFDVPSDAEILGIEARARRRADSAADPVRDEVVRLTKGGTIVGDDKASGASWPTATVDEAKYGGPSSLWGTDWTPSTVNAAGFGVVLAAYGMFTAFVDSLRLTVYYRIPGLELAFTGAPTLRFSPDEADPDVLPLSAELKTEMPGGFSAASFTVAKPEFFEPEDYLYANSRIYEHETGTVWHEGRVVGVSENDEQVTFEIEGWANHLSDDATARWIPYDRDFGAWSGATTQRRLNAAVDENRLEDASANPDPLTGEPSLQLAVTGPQAEWPTYVSAEGWYDALGLEIARLDYAFKLSAEIALNASDPKWIWGAQLSSDDVASDLDDSGNLNAGTGGPGAGTVVASGVDKFWSRVFVVYFGGPGPEAEQALTYSVFFTVLAAVGTHGLPLQGSVAHTPPAGRGLFVSDMVDYVVGRWAPRLLVRNGIRPTTFVVPHMAFREPSPPMDQIESMLLLGSETDFYPLDWYVWEEREFGLASPLDHGNDWRTSYEEGAVAAGSGPDAQRMLNGIRVTYDDGTGRKLSVGPPGSDSDTEVSELVDVSEANPVNRDGARHWETFDAGITTEAGALMIGRTILADRNRQLWRGSITTPAEVRDDAGVWHQAAEVRAGDSIVIEDDDDARRRRIVETSWADDDRRNELSIGAPPDRFDSLLARLAAALGGRAGGTSGTRRPPRPPRP